jgi:nitroreductase
LTSGQIQAYFTGRRSIRNFKTESVEKVVVEKIMDIARFAPSAVNRHALQWSILLSKDAVKKVAGLVIEFAEHMLRTKSPLAVQFTMQAMVDSWKRGSDPICRKASGLVVAHAPKDDRMATIDAAIALSHIELIAPAFGLGACWAGYLNIAAGASPTVKEALGVPPDNASLGALMIGYPKYKMQRAPKRKAPVITWN